MDEAPAKHSPATLMSQRAYARQRGCSQQAVNAQTADHGGPILTYGKHRQIDPAEADRLWPAWTNGAPPPSPVRELDRQRVRKLKADAARAELELRVRKGELLDRRQARDAAFRFGRLLRDRWQAWPGHVGPLLAATFNLDASAVTVALENYVRDHLTELAGESVEF